MVNGKEVIGNDSAGEKIEDRGLEAGKNGDRTPQTGDRKKDFGLRMSDFGLKREN